MPDSLADFLQQTTDRELTHLRAITDEQAARSPRSGWTRKEELGHLIDSAANNHIRFVSAALKNDYHGVGYDQNGWVRLHNYAHTPWETIVSFWYAYNTLIAEVVRNIPEDRLPTKCVIGTDDPVTLGFLIEDYVVHMQHHIDQLLGREIVTQYPQAATAPV